MKALVTGANGLVGANLVRVLHAAGHEVRAMVRTTSDLRGLAGENVELAYGDLADVDSIERAGASCDVMFHAAAIFAYWGHSTDDLEAANVTGTENALTAAARVGMTRVVLTSSSVVRGSAADRFAALPTDDGARASADTPAYYASKVRQENLAVETAESLGLDLVVVQPTLTVGPPDYRLVPSNAIVANYLNDPVRATFPGGVNIVDVEDVARGHLLVAEKGVAGERYLLGSENWTWPHVHRTISELCGIGGPMVTATRTSAYLTAALMEVTARVTGRAPVTTRAEARTVGRYYWYRHDEAAALGYAPRPTRWALARSIAWLVANGHVRDVVRAGLVLGPEVVEALDLRSEATGLGGPSPTAG